MADDGLDISGKWEGLQETKTNLMQMGKIVASKVVRGVIRQIAKYIQAEVINEAPVESGLTRDSIKVRAGKKKRNKISMLVQMSKGSFGDAFYVGFANYGWTWSKHRTQTIRSKYRKLGIERPTQEGEKKIPGSHWLERVEEKVTPQAERMLKELLDAEIQKIKSQKTNL